MANHYWIKLYIEILDDPKMGKMPDWLWRRTVELFLLAGENGNDGRLPPVSDMAWRLRLDEIKLGEALRALEQVGVAGKTPDGQWYLVNFAKRQAATDGAERMRRLRQGKRHSEYSGDKVRDETSQNRHTDTESETETESDVEPENDAPCLSELSVAFCNATSIPELTGGIEKWTRALEELNKAGVIPKDIEQAVSDMRDKGYSIVNLRSIVNPAISAMSKRVKGHGAPSNPTPQIPAEVY